MIRVVSLLPAGTEIVASLGAATWLVGISHECDYPAEVLGLPRVTATPIDPEWSSGKVDAAVRELGSQGRPVVAVDGEQIRRLAPDLIVSQTLCEVCAVADGEVHRLVNVLSPVPRVVSLNAGELDGIWRDIEAVGSELDLKDEAMELNLGLKDRLRRLAGDTRSTRPRVLTIEWLDPPFTAGHWVPELIHIAGGQDSAAQPGQHSRQISWTDAAQLRPEVVVVMLCGFSLERSLRELKELTDPAAIAFLGSLPVWVLDGNAYTSRAGPRVVDGAHLIHLALRNIESDGIVRYH